MTPQAECAIQLSQAMHHDFMLRVVSHPAVSNGDTSPIHLDNLPANKRATKTKLQSQKAGLQGKPQSFLQGCEGLGIETGLDLQQAIQRKQLKPAQNPPGAQSQDKTSPPTQGSWHSGGAAARGAARDTSPAARRSSRRDWRASGGSEASELGIGRGGCGFWVLGAWRSDCLASRWRVAVTARFQSIPTTSNSNYSFKLSPDGHGTMDGAVHAPKPFAWFCVPRRHRPCIDLTPCV